MKTLNYFSILLVLFFTLSISSQAQININKLKGKAANLKKANSGKGLKSTALSGNKNSNASTSSNSNTNANNNTSNNTSTSKANSTEDNNDEDYATFIQTHYWMIDDLLKAEGSYGGSIFSDEMYVNEYYEKAVEMDYPQTYAKAIKKKGIGADKYKYDKLIGFKAKYKEYFENNIKGEINNSIEDAYKIKDHNKKEAIDKAQLVNKMCDAVLMSIPDHEGAKTLKKDADKVLNDLGGAYFAKIFTSEFHKKNVGKILFSDKPIFIGKEDPNQFKTSFTADENIYAMVYLDGTLADLSGNAYDISGGYMVGIDGNPTYNNRITFMHNKEDHQKSYYHIEIIPSPDVAVHGLDATEWSKVLTKMSPRNHTLKVEFVIGGLGEAIAESEFKIDWSNADNEKINENAKKASDNAKTNWAKNLQLPEEFKHTSQKFSSSELSHTNIKAILAKNWSNCSAVTKLVVLGDGTAEDWYIHKNDLDIPTHKETNPAIVATYKGKDGWCYYVEGISLKKEYLGGGSYGKATLFAEDRHIKIDCANIK